MIRNTPIKRTAFAPTEPKPPAGPRKRKCVVCRELFEPRSMTHKACRVECAAVHAESTRKAQDRKTDRQRKQDLKTRQDWLREAQAVFNSFVRERDKDLPCISCGRFHSGSYDAGHYRSVGAMPALRFCEINVHRQCVPCNQHKAGNIVEYRLGLVKRIGEISVQWLEIDHPPAKLTIDEIKAIKSEYSKKLKQLKDQS